MLNALQGRAHQGVAQPRLSELGLPTTATTDPYTDKPLHLKKTLGGWLVYSVGKDLEDNGGDLSEARDVGVGPIPPADGK